MRIVTFKKIMKPENLGLFVTQPDSKQIDKDKELISENINIT